MTHPDTFVIEAPRLSAEDFDQMIRFPDPGKPHSIPVKGRLFLVDLLVHAGSISVQVDDVERFVPQYIPSHYVTDSIMTALSIVNCERVYQHRISMIQFPTETDSSLDYCSKPKIVTQVWESSFYDDDICGELTVRAFTFSDGAKYLDRRLNERQKKLAETRCFCRYNVLSTQTTAKGN